MRLASISSAAQSSSALKRLMRKTFPIMSASFKDDTDAGFGLFFDPSGLPRRFGDSLKVSPVAPSSVRSAVRSVRCSLGVRSKSMGLMNASPSTLSGLPEGSAILDEDSVTPVSFRFGSTYGFENPSSMTVFDFGILLSFQIG